MYQILTLNNISPLGLERLPGGRYRVGNDIKNPDAILVRVRRLTKRPLFLGISMKLSASCTS